jgi:hypothetical protein
MLGVFLALLMAAPSVRADDPLPPTPRIFHKARTFRIPFNVDASERARLHEVQLWWSSDLGDSWKCSDRATPDRTYFTFQADSDGEYWFAVRTRDARGRLYPSDDDGVEAKLKVVVDTTPPSLVLSFRGRRGSQVTLRYEARDENIDLTKLHLEYQVEGATTWRKVPLKRPVLSSNEVVFDAATADVLRIRGSVVDKAGNGKIAELDVPEGLPDGSELADIGPDEMAEAPAPPPIAPIVRNGPRPSTNTAARSRAAPRGPVDDPPPLEESPGGGTGPREYEGPPGAAPRVMVGAPRFPLKYAVDDAGPGGPATVELWVTRDNGRTWSYLGQDPDRASPFLVELPGDGVYGLKIVARSASGLGDLPPRQGEPPEIEVEIDTTPPFVRMGPVSLVSGSAEQAVRITWKAEDAHLGPKPVIISYRPDRPDGIWQQVTPPLPNTGQYVWKLPPNLPGKVHFRVDVIDTLDNRGWAETPENAPVVVDRSRPRGKILGLDQGAAGGGGRSRY